MLAILRAKCSLARSECREQLSRLIILTGSLTRKGEANEVIELAAKLRDGG